MLLPIFVLDLFGRAIVEGLVHTLGVPPVDPCECSDLDVENISPTAGVDDFVLVRAIDILGQRIVIAITDATGGFNYPGIDQVLMVGKRNIL